MDIDFIQLQHRENVLKLMEICGLEMKEAYDLYVESGYNFEVAVNKKFNPVPQAQQNPPPQLVPNVPNASYFRPPPIFPVFENQIYEEDTDYKYSQYKKFVTNGKPFDKKYPVRKHQTFFERILPKFFKGEDEDPFKKELEKYIEKHINLKNTVGNLSQVMQWSWKQKYPVLIMILDFSVEKVEEVKRLFSDDMFIEQVLNQQFKLYGISAFSYQLEEELKIYFNFQRDLNHFVVCRVNNVDQIEILHRIPITEPYEEIKRKLKQVKSECIQLEMEESNIVKQFQEERRGNFNFRRPRTVKENIKLKQDRKIRQQQQQEFFKACLPKKEQQKPSKVQQDYRETEKFKDRQRKAQQVEKKVIKQEISEQFIRKERQDKFSNLKKYSSGLSFKIRVPSGQNLIINVEGQQRVQYLFDYISFQPSDLGFANDHLRQFDIFIGFGGTQKLKGKQKQQLKNLFEDSEVLIVRQTVE